MAKVTAWAALSVSVVRISHTIGILEEEEDDAVAASGRIRNRATGGKIPAIFSVKVRINCIF